jgi:hypothetical protein
LPDPDDAPAEPDDDSLEPDEEPFDPDDDPFAPDDSFDPADPFDADVETVESLFESASTFSDDPEPALALLSVR